MITYKEIKKAINLKIERAFQAPINSRDVKEGFKRPSFFVQLENSRRSGDVSQVHKATTIQIYYFPSDRYEYSIEVLEVQEKLENIFDLKLQVLDRFFNIDEAESDVTDGVLNFFFDIEFYDGRKMSYESVVCYVDEGGNYLVDVDNRLVIDKTDIPDGVVVVDPDEVPIGGEVAPIHVQSDEVGFPVLDGEGKPIPMEAMKTLEMKE